MSNEKPAGQKKPEDTRLGVEDARDLANMQRAEIKAMENDTSMRFDEGFLAETTAADYDGALETIEELKKLAAEEPAADKVIAIFARATEKARFLVMNAISIGWYPGIEYEEKMKKLEDAAGRLRELKEQAKQY
jgi:hypothetical protein